MPKFTCRKCGALVSPESPKCPQCGQLVAPEEEELLIGEADEPADEPKQTGANKGPVSQPATRVPPVAAAPMAATPTAEAPQTSWLSRIFSGLLFWWPARRRNVLDYYPDPAPSPPAPSQRRPKKPGDDKPPSGREKPTKPPVETPTANPGRRSSRVQVAKAEAAMRDARGPQESLHLSGEDAPAAETPPTPTEKSRGKLGLDTVRNMSDDTVRLMPDGTSASPPVDITESESPPGQLYGLEILNSESREWEVLCEVGPSGIRVGRSHGDVNLAEEETMAATHARFGYDDQGHFFVKDLGSRNGVFRQLREPMKLASGIRFRVADHLLEFREVRSAASPRPVDPLEEQLWSRDIKLLGQLALIREDGSIPCLFPIIKPLIYIGRDPDTTDIALVGDMTSSRQHAVVYEEENTLWLKDNGSQNGTYVLLREPEQLDAGDMILLGKARLRVKTLDGPAKPLRQS